MMIPLRDYDLAGAKRRMRALFARERGVAWSDFTTKRLRTLTGPADAVLVIQYALIRALTALPPRAGGTAIPCLAQIDLLRRGLPLVEALMIVRGHPAHPGFDSLAFRRADQPFPETPADWERYEVAPLLEQLYADKPERWDLARLEALVVSAMHRAYGDEEIDASWMLDEIYPGSLIGKYTDILDELATMEVFGAFDMAFARRDALVGEWWVLQPVSPRIDLIELLQPRGLVFGGYLPQAHVDVPGRVLLAFHEGWCDRIIDHPLFFADCKWIAGSQFVCWSKARAPLADPHFDLLPWPLPDLPDGDGPPYGPYKHSSELPPWPPRKR